LLRHHTQVRAGGLQGGPQVVALLGERAVEQALGPLAVAIEQRIGADLGQRARVVGIAGEVALEQRARLLLLPGFAVHARDAPDIAVVVLARQQLVEDRLAFVPELAQVVHAAHADALPAAVPGLLRGQAQQTARRLLVRLALVQPRRR